MPERRQAVRREPIEVELADGRVFTAHPLDWLSANNLGNEILRQNTNVMNEMLRMYVSDEGVPQLEFKLKVKITDWATLFTMAYPSEPEEKFNKPRIPDIDESAELILASLDVNHLEHIKHLVDPNSPAPTLPGGNDTSAEGEQTLGPKIVSILASSSEESAENPSLPSPAVTSSP